MSEDENRDIEDKKNTQNVQIGTYGECQLLKHPLKNWKKEKS